MKVGKIYKVSGPLVVCKGLEGARMYDVCYVGEEKLIGEIIALSSDLTYIQVYEDTAGLGVNDPVFPTYQPLMVELGPGLISSIYDGIQRPLDKIRVLAGDFITRGILIPALDREKKWYFKPLVKPPLVVSGGDIVGEVKETDLVSHKIMIPPEISGELIELKEGEFSVEEPIGKIRTKDKIIDLKLYHKWPVRKERPYQNKLPPKEILATGQRVVDTFFPIAKGGTACVPGPFGSGKTVIQHQFSKWADAEIVIFIGCGERGNEMTDVLIEFPKLKDPKSGEPLMKRTVLIANTSNMPVAAREASVYTGITIGEYFRDMGYSVTLQADSTSRWAEAMREISGRLEEMPGEEGYPAYLQRRIAEFYERAGRVRALGKPEREGALSVIGSVSPPGGDMGDPVVQATLRVVKVFWSLEDKLAYQRHFPAISWLNSYSLYQQDLVEDLSRKVAPDFVELSKEAMRILEKEAELLEIVRLVGKDTLSPSDRLILEAARIIREDFLHQNAFLEIDTYTSLKKQYEMLKICLYFYEKAKKVLNENKLTIEDIEKLKVRERIAKMKFVKEEEMEKEFSEIKRELEECLK